MPVLRSFRMAAALATALVVSACTTVGPVNEQNWSVQDQRAWRRASQGSRLIPYRWLLALKDADGAPFMRPETILRYRYLLPDPDERTVLPVGFAIDSNRHSVQLSTTDLRWYKGQDSHEPWVGMNCSACHTAELIVNDQPRRIDGGPTMADFEGFTDALRANVNATADDPARWSAFAATVLGPQTIDSYGNPKKTPSRDTPEARDKLRVVFETYRTQLNELAALSAPDPDDPAYGPGRLDAVGHILNKVAYLAKNKGQFRAPAGAPVSYPFLWNIPQHKVLQWNGIAPNKPIEVGGRTILDAGALIRNVSEVIGVFADVSVSSPTGLKKLDGFPSSIDVTNLAAMESQLTRLKPPKWPTPTAFTQKLADRGADLFVSKHCNDCHTVMSRDDLKSPTNEHMTPIFGPGGVGTDPWMACNAYSFRAFTGRLSGNYPRYIKTAGADKLSGITETRTLLVTTSIGVMAGKKQQLVEAAVTGLFDPYQRPALAFAQFEQPGKADRLIECQRAWASTPAQAPDRGLLQYKGRPLNGIWATGPYLHNGSVRTLDELLKEPRLRAKSFWIGSRRLDIDGVGYMDENVPGSWQFRTQDAAGRLIPGNDNRGHDYNNAGISPDERKALVEYMKSL
jgi:hypothetical protein